MRQAIILFIAVATLLSGCRPAANDDQNRDKPDKPLAGKSPDRGEAQSRGELHLNVAGRDGIVLEGKSYYLKDLPAAIKRSLDALRKETGVEFNPADARIVIQAGREATYGDVKSTIKSCQEAGIENFALLDSEHSYAFDMPLAQAAAVDLTEEIVLPLKVRIKADDNGKSVAFLLGLEHLPSLAAVQNRIVAFSKGRTLDHDVELICDDRLNYENVLQACRALSHRLDAEGNKVVLAQRIYPFGKTYPEEEIISEELIQPLSEIPVDSPELTDLSSEKGEVPKGLPDEVIEELNKKGLRESVDILPLNIDLDTPNASSAIDRVTHEILLSLEERHTLVVWLLDNSHRRMKQRKEFSARLQRIVEEVGLADAAKNAAFEKRDNHPLLHVVAGFGESVAVATGEPSYKLKVLQKAIADMPIEKAGDANVFSAVSKMADKYKSYRIPAAKSGRPQRNILFFVFTDVAGDDQDGLDRTIQQCKRYQIPVYVVGTPAPFGRRVTMVKGEASVPGGKQNPQWIPVRQGPESLMPERLKLNLFDQEDDAGNLDSGFGPFALTRLCYETGGIYFSVHPNRNTKRSVSRNETAQHASHLQHFFGPQVMRRYRPDYVSTEEYARRTKGNKSRAALLKGAMQTWTRPMHSPARRFIFENQTLFLQSLLSQQKAAARLAVELQMLEGVFKQGEADREKEAAPRWQAGFDLAMGRVLAAKLRLDNYNRALAKAKLGMEFADSKNNTWTLTPAKDDNPTAQSKATAEKARRLLMRVVDEHAKTPWAILAERELNNPFGWEWLESYTDEKGKPSPAR